MNQTTNKNDRGREQIKQQIRRGRELRPETDEQQTETPDLAGETARESDNSPERSQWAAEQSYAGEVAGGRVSEGEVSR